MSDYPSRHPYPRPNKDSRPFDYEGDRDFAAAWQAHVLAGRVGVRLEASDEVRAIREANERLIRGNGRLGIG